MFRESRAADAARVKTQPDRSGLPGAPRPEMNAMNPK
jgi:hypothetical protein